MATSMTKDEMLEQVRVNLLRMMEQDKTPNMHTVAIAIGYSYDTVVKYANGSIMTMPVANALVRVYPWLGENFVCPCCGRLTT